MMQISAQAGLAALQQVGRMFGAVTADKGSLIQYADVARVEPLTIIDSACLYSEMLPDVQQSLLSIFAGYYLQAFSLSMTIGKIDVSKHLEKFSPNRNVGSAVGQFVGNQIGTEGLDDFTHRLPVYGDPRNIVDYQNKLALEAVRDDDKNKNYKGGPAVKDIGQITTDLANLAVGKLINVEITDGEKKAVIPLAFRLLTNGINSDNLIHILSGGSKEVSYGERIHQWKTGQIQFWKDLVFCQDLIDEHKKHLMDDKSGLYDAILARRTNNKISSFLTGNWSVATASNLCVMSSTTLTRLELDHGPFSSFKVRQKIFDKTYMMIIAVINEDHGRVTFYHRGVPDVTTVSHRDMKALNKGSGPDIKEILSAYRAGTSPNL